MDATRLRMDLNLRNISLISIAEKLWDSQDIKNRIKSNFSGLDWDWDYPDENWCEISKVVVEKANSINLPPSLSALLKNTVLLIGQKIYDWIFYVTEILGLDWIFTQKIYFRFGVVDEIKIFDLYWRDLMASDYFISEPHSFIHFQLFLLACIFGHERFVRERKNEMLDELSEFYPEIKTGDEIYNIMSAYICSIRNEIIIENAASPQRMFEVCLEAGFSKAARFYWEKLDEVEKLPNLTNFAKKCWRKGHESSFVMGKHCENLLFLINEMGEEEKSLFFAGYADKIIELFLSVWPYQELIVDLLKYDWNIKLSRLTKVANFLIAFSIIINSLEFPLDNELLFQIMQKVWGYIPVKEKLNFLKCGNFPISDYFLNFNPEILNLLFNDPSMTEAFGLTLDFYIERGFLELAKMGKFDILNAVIETVFNFMPEPKEFLKEKFSRHVFVLDLLKRDKSFGLVDQCLDWSAESEEERASLKNQIKIITVCRSLTEPDYGYVDFELADKFLKWMLETDAEVKSFKEKMRCYNFVIVRGVFWGYVRIKCGDLSWLSPGDELAMHLNEDPFNNAEGLTFLKIEDATELNRGIALGIKSFCSGMDYDFLGPNWRHAKRERVDYVGTDVGDFIVFTVRKIWSNKGKSYYSDLNLEKAVNLSNAFIKFYYETDEEVVKFKKTKLHLLVTENLTEFLLGACGYAHGPEIILDNFCEFCMIPSEKIEETKIQHRSNIEKVLDTHLVDGLEFQFCDYFLNFLFGEFKKTEVSKKFVNSSNKGALMCVSYLKKFGEVCPYLVTDFEILRWLILVDNKEKLKNDVFALYENIPEWFDGLLRSVAHSDVNTDG